MKVALVHDYLNQMGGAEHCVLQFMQLFPDAPIYTSLFDPDRVDPRFARADVRTSFLQKLPFARRHFRAYLPLFPLAFESFDLRGYDLVLSCTTAWTQGILTDPETCHVAYVNTPMRFGWRPADYLEAGDIPAIARPAFHILMHHFRNWDLAAARRTDHLIANSQNVARRIAKFYGRGSTVIHPPVSVAKFALAQGPGEGYVVVSRLKSYKRIDLVIQAANQKRAPLTIIGEGPDRARLTRLSGPTIRFVGRVSEAELARLVGAARALIVATEEDFGIAPLEANAAGRPVVALSRGGATETVIPANGYPEWLSTTPQWRTDHPHPTGVFFHEQTPEALAAALTDLETRTFEPASLRAHALTFDDAQFRRHIAEEVEKALSRHHARYRTLGASHEDEP